jgi:hypothetical protein
MTLSSALLHVIRKFKVPQLVQILYNFDRFVTPRWPWHAWRNFHFVTLLWEPWQGPNFVRCGLVSRYFNIVWAGLSWNLRRWTQNKPFIQGISEFRLKLSYLAVCDSIWPFVRTPPWPVTTPIFWHVRYPLWPVTDESIEIVQYYDNLTPHKHFTAIQHCITTLEWFWAR